MLFTMSLHSSLRIDFTRTKFRNVLKRHERIQRLIELEKWNDRSSVFGLPKVKSIRVKMKKGKESKAEVVASGAAGAATSVTGAGASPTAKGTAGGGKSVSGASSAGATSSEKRKPAAEKK